MATKKIEMRGKQQLKIKKMVGESEFASFVRQISTSAIIKKTYETSKETYFDGCTQENLLKHISTIDIKNRKPIKQDVMIQPWHFADLIYQSVKYSNDYRGVQQMTDDMFLMTLLQTSEFINLKSKNIITRPKNEYELSLILFGSGGEQFKYQNEFSFYHYLIRELYIIFSLSKKYPSKIKPESIVLSEIGVEWKDVFLVLFGVYINSLFEQNVKSAIDYLNFDTGKNKEEIFNKVLEYYSIDYHGIRTSTLGRQIFYTKPYIITQKNCLVSASVYFNQFIVEHAAFWIIRNYFINKQKEESQTFTDEFGLLFEQYFFDLCIEYNTDFEKSLKQPRKERIGN